MRSRNENFFLAVFYKSPKSQIRGKIPIIIKRNHMVFKRLREDTSTLREHVILNG